MVDAPANSFFKPTTIKILLSVFQYFYVVSSVVLLFVFFLTLAKGQAQTLLLPAFIITALIAFGIYNKRAWAPLVITLLAAFGIIRNLLQMPEEPFISLLLIAVLTFESYFFNLKEVKHLFKTGKATRLV